MAKKKREKQAVGPKPVKALLVRPDGTTHVVAPMSLKDFQAEVGGNIEPIYFGNMAVAYVNEDGKTIPGLRHNFPATGICHALRVGLPLDDVILGNMLIVGPIVDGDNTDCPEQIIAYVRKHLEA